MKVDPHSESRPFQEELEYEPAYQIAKGEFTVYFTNFLHWCMIPCFEEAEREVFHPTFLRFMHLALLSSFKKLRSLKSCLSQEITKKEKYFLKRLAFQGDFGLDSKMSLALDRFNSEFPNFINKCAGFDRSRNHESYLKIFSSGIISEFEKCMRYTSSLSRNNEILQNTNAVENNLPVRISLCSNQELEQLRLSPSLLQLLADTKKHLVYYICVASERIILKVLKSALPSINDIQKLDNEFQIGRKVSHSAFRFSLARKTFQSKHAILLEWADGFPISKLKPLSAKDFLMIAREIVSAVSAMHMNHIIHMNLTCEHIIFDSKSNAVKIIGYGSSTGFCSKKVYISNEELHEKDLRCISPEQTGRVNRDDIDYRTDFYSLGVIFYKLITGHYPFESKDALKLVHLHILEDPPPISSVIYNIPRPISDMISKLMKKDVGERYKSAKCIILDIELMISEFDSDENLTNVTLSQHDLPEILLISQKLYGRSTHYNTLLEVFNKVFPTSSELVFITGESGSGKSALVLELYKEVSRKNAFLSIGKCDSNKLRPYNALVEAAQNFCVDLLSRDKVIIESYKSKIQDAVKDEGALLTNVISNLHLLIGQQPCISDAFGEQAKNRFLYVFVQFVKAICSGGFPIILVVEDLQWLDVDSLGILHALITAKSIKNLMLICIYRNSEISDEHSISGLLQKIKDTNFNVTKIELANLDQEETNNLISDTLCISSFKTYSLTAWIHEKTKGNPFFIKQVLKSLYNKSQIYFCNDIARWRWNSNFTGENDITGDVLELIRHQITALDQLSQQVLKVASCLESPFSLRAINLVVNNKSIEDALSSGMIIQYKGSSNLFCFVHNQIQKAAFSLLSENKSLFSYIGKKLLKNFSCKELYDNIYTVANLLCYSIDHKKDLGMAEFFLEAGLKAMESTAFKRAFEYLGAGIHLMGPGDFWKSHYELSLELHYLSAKAAYCLKNYSTMNSFIDEIFKRVTSAIHLVSCYSLRIRYFNDKHRYDDAVCTAEECVHMCNDMINVDLSLDLPDSEIASQTQKAKKIIFDKSNKDILGMKEMDDINLLLVMMIFNDVLCSAFSTNYKLYSKIVIRMVELTIQHGISKYSSSGFCGFATLLCNQGDTLAYQVGKLSLLIADKTKAKELAPGVYTGFYSLISPFYSSIHHSLKDNALLKSYKICLEIGSSHDANLICITYCRYAFLSGQPLNTLLEHIENFKDSISKSSMNFLAVHQSVLNLVNIRDNKNPSILSGEIFDSFSYFDRHDESPYNIAGILIQCLVLAYMFNDYPSAINFAKRCKPHIRHIVPTFLYPIYLFYNSLASLALGKQIENKKEKWMPNVEENLLELKKMSINAPENYLNKVNLLEAEIAAVHGFETKAVAHYEESIRLSDAYGFLHEEAIANERAGLFCVEQKSSLASDFIFQSRRCYKEWGAIAKKAQVTTNYPLHRSSTNSIFLHLDSYSHDYVQLEENRSNASISQLTEPSHFSYNEHGNQQIKKLDS